MKNPIKFFAKNVDFDQFLAFLATLISLICALMPAFFGITPLAIVTAVIGILCFIILVDYLYTITNKSKVLQILSDENRSLSIRLLLTYESLKQHSNPHDEIFQTGNLDIDKATYRYEVKKNGTKDGPFDLKCTWTFELKKSRKTDSISFLISQPRGIKTHTITYTVNNVSFDGSVRPVPLTNHSDFKGFLRCTIPPQSHLEKLSIEFTMKKAYQAKTTGAFLTCPFFFAKSIRNLTIQCDYQEVNDIIQPANFSLLFYPYDGRKCKVKRIGSFVKDKEKSIWECSVSRDLICSQAIYITEISHQKN